MGCFWGAERLFWETDGVFVTSVGFMGGHLDNPSYEDVCGGDSGHTETVKVVYHPDILSLKQIVHLFIDHSSVQSDIRFTKDEDETKKHRCILPQTQEKLKKDFEVFTFYSRSDLSAHAELLRPTFRRTTIVLQCFFDWH